ncbi:MAG TPA: type IV pilus twitching motility protein PilT [Acidobacteriota bacterium]
MNIDALLRSAVERDASDLHLKVGNHPFLRIHGVLEPLLEVERLTKEDTLTAAFHIMNNLQKERFKEKLDIDISYSVPGLGRFRCNIYNQRGSVGLALRTISATIPSIRELNLPTVLEKVAMEQRGLVLVTGTTGSGKSTTLSSMIDFMNSHRVEHILTIEDPIEFLHRDKKSIVNQREIGSDCLSFANSLRSGLRQDPDIILVGELRDQETIETALAAAETGHLVLSTLHTLDATETIHRIISVFPPHQQQQIRFQLAATLRAVISMRLLKRADRLGRVPAVEVLIATDMVRECIVIPEKTKSIHDAIEGGVSQYGMQSFDQSLFKLYEAGLISLEEATRGASNPNDFKLKVQGIQSTGDMARSEMESTMDRDYLAPNREPAASASRFAFTGTDE